MAGWLISINDLKFVELYAENGVYGYRFPRKDDWRQEQWNTIADFALFEDGDLIFFFCKRNIYGIGKVINSNNMEMGSPVLINYKDSLLPSETLKSSEACFWDEQFREGLWAKKDRGKFDIRLIVLFKPCPAFYKNGLDMDFVLQGDAGGIARQIRTFQGVGFIRLEKGDIDLLIELFTRNFNQESPLFGFNDANQKRIINSASGKESAFFNPRILFVKYTDGTLFKREGLLQIAVANGLARNIKNFVSVLGGWDYVCNQVKVSPLKPVSYMDKADVFGLSYKSLNKTRLPSALDRFLILELKKDSFKNAKQGTLKAEEIKNAFSQTMKYVDWVANYRAGGDYSLISASLITGGFPAELITYVGTHGKRDYIIPRRPYEAKHWANLKLIEYSVSNGEVSLNEVKVPG
jgi:hypothetical protein